MANHTLLPPPMKQVLRWDGSGCVFTNATSPTGETLSSDCCAGGWLQPNDLPMTPGTLIGWMLILLWIFLGVALGADVFMTSIERITSAEVLRKVTTKTGDVKYFHVRVWNETMANLTLMALGSSAPEILLNVLEIVLGNFEAGALGPSTIVGSAAFNLMVISAVCVMCIPAGDSRTIRRLGVFLVTASFSVIAYIWLLLMVVVISPDVIEWWEALLTCLLMVLLLLIAYKVDKASSYSKFKISLTGSKFQSDSSGNLLMDTKGNSKNAEVWTAAKEAGLIPDKLGKGAEGGISAKDLAENLQDLVAPMRSKAYYRHQAMQEMPGGVVNHHRKGPPPPANSPLESIKLEGVAKVFPTETQQGMAAVAVQTQLVTDAQTQMVTDSTKQPQPLSSNAPSAGVVRFVREAVAVKESAGSVTVQVERVLGSQGALTVQYSTKDQQALGGKDYEPVSGVLSFADGEVGPLDIAISVLDDDDYEKDETFTVVLSELTGGAIYDRETDGGETSAICTVTILNDDMRTSRFAQAMAILKLDLDELDLAEVSWADQIKDVFQLPKRPVAAVIAVLSGPWRLLFALVPPPGLCGGWPCFCLALCFIGFQVVLISDFANQMGCQMSLTPGITAITFVALGTSLPDLFASKQAAIGDKTADNSIGNVTGSNSVNVFAGLGVPWLMASIYWEVQGPTDYWMAKYGDVFRAGGKSGFVVRAGGLGFSVLIFTLCAITTIAIILLRRPYELGGGVRTKYATGAAFISMWFLYVILSSLADVGSITPPI
eukprot:CAMPEP_0174727602 /NCGR_PEP_ID=MMETSP1094-20130205/50101_1 /TAXON_ID=156173 /ORGANISM="Chrysochromulina brevifilum, Strain UTEX LB 985" /LENGTH=772 /DNA_ID=CAMNT_0015929377 /DNA_START=10 /DNA_END=2328 /DNA_ORIENTATION=+